MRFMVITKTIVGCVIINMGTEKIVTFRCYCDVCSRGDQGGWQGDRPVPLGWKKLYANQSVMDSSGPSGYPEEEVLIVCPKHTILIDGKKGWPEN
jgi:hypothetical protein